MSESKNNQNQLSDIIALIYDSSQNPKSWPALLSYLNEVTEESPSTLPNSHAYVPLLETHFERASTLNNEISQLQRECKAMSSIFDRLPIGIILLTSDSHPIAINLHAKQVLTSGDTLRIQKGKLIPRDSAYKTSLVSIIKQAACHQTKDCAPPKSLQLFSHQGTPYSLWITPSAHNNLDTGEGLAAVFIASSDIYQYISSQSLESMYRLTKAEARLLQKLICDCDSLNEAASELNVSIHTVRTQLKSIMEKTDTHSQVALVKKVLRSPAMLIGESQSVESITDLESLEHLKNQDLPRNVHLFSLPNGRVMEYTEHGDPKGVPLIYFHGILHSKTKFHPYSHYAEEHGIRIIAVERPGFGLSARQKRFSLEAYANDVRQLTQQLKLDKFYVLGDGDGGPAALACASQLPEQVYRVAITGCMPDPSFEHLENLLPFDHKLMVVARSTPDMILYPLSKIILKALKKNNNFFNLMAKDFYKTDWNIVQSPEHQKIFRDSLDNLSPENMDGFIDDYFSRLQDWDFQAKEIKTEVHLWHGIHDCFSNIESGRDIAKALPQCQAHFLENNGHYIFISHIDQILETLIHKDKLQERSDSIRI